ncbi:hypothetical protein [Thiolapillus brandeum]|uniref:Uncharacterized protein n=1 Tax=Thiolapillus brandeum TaxID=1076588 RepID=A0A7U6GLB3_9GAMM|nr:hypothetical protein [Thiolapillus brandeum]BAO45725.1 hypothetical protein TBH_C2824 [Thiolapillus brandeum]
MSWKPGMVAVVIWGLLASPTYAGAVDFQQLLTEGGLEFTPPQELKQVPVAPDYVMPYEARYTTESGDLEVRYAIRPLNRIEIDYSDPHNAAPAPNDLFNMLFRTLTETLAKEHRVVSRSYPPEKAREDYRAGWAAVGVFDVSPDISKRYQEAMLIAIHQNDKADAYILFLTNDLAAEKERIKKLRTSLKFKSFDKPINMPPSPEELKKLPMIPESSTEN